MTPTKYFLLPILLAHDRSRFEVYGYNLTDSQDAATEEFRQAADHWRDLAGKTVEEIRNTILQDQIDILVDMSGHFAPHALSVFQQRAAPVQIALPNYPGTTGCSEIDLLLSDSWMTPGQAAEEHYAEKQVRRLPSGYIVFQQPTESPALTPLPAAQNKHVTFGLFQRPAKWSEALWQAVANILRRCSNSRLLIQHATRDLEEENSASRRAVLGPLDRLGIAPHRVSFQGIASAYRFFEIISQVDIALDTWPYNGQTTTCCCFWMGVPVVSLAGSTHASRVGLSLLSRVGLTAWAAHSPEQYIEIAVAKAGDLSMLAQLRADLRDRMAATLCRADPVVRDMENTYQLLWDHWRNSLEGIDKLIPATCG